MYYVVIVCSVDVRMRTCVCVEELESLSCVPREVLYPCVPRQSSTHTTVCLDNIQCFTQCKKIGHQLQS